MTAQSVRIDHTAGSRQSFVTDCENCCRPIEIEIDVESDGYVNLTAKREGEGWSSGNFYTIFLDNRA